MAISIIFLVVVLILILFLIVGSLKTQDYGMTSICVLSFCFVLLALLDFIDILIHG